MPTAFSTSVSPRRRTTSGIQDAFNGICSFQSFLSASRSSEIDDRCATTETGRGLKQSVNVSAASPAVSVDVSAGPFSGFLSRMASYLQNDARMLRVSYSSHVGSVEEPLRSLAEHL